MKTAIPSDRAERKRAAKLLKQFNLNSYIVHEDPIRVIIATGFDDPSSNEKTGAMIQIWILAKQAKPSALAASGLDNVICGNCWKRPSADHSVPEAIDYAQAESLGWRAFITVDKDQRLVGHVVCPASNEAKLARAARGIAKDIKCENCGLCKGKAISAKSVTIEKHGSRPDRCYVQMRAPNSIWQAYKRGRYARLVDLSLLRGRKIRFGAYGDPIHIPFPIVKAIASVADNYTGYTHQWANPMYRAYSAFFMASTNAARA